MQIDMLEFVSLDNVTKGFDVKSWYWVALIVVATVLTIVNNCIVISYLVMKPPGQQTVLDRHTFFHRFFQQYF